ncbi:putative secretory lipase [Thozetella sp. PMI_491]|nr:putative secretory lipase [Thozetella sp. PMI_491]
MLANPSWRLCASLAAIVGATAACAITNVSSTTCGLDCQKVAALGSSWEADQHASADFSFYAVPSNFSASLPAGTLLKVEPATNLSNFSVPGSLSMSRIIYTTTDLNGTILPASAYILWPYAPLASATHTKQPFPMVAWAHGTSGLLKGCAPSNYRNLQYHFMAPFLLALQGMVVVAPDYAGLGIDYTPSGKPIGHPWLAGPAQANDLANAILASRRAFPSQLAADGSFVALGHSQGGAAVWSFAERQASRPIPGYQGAAAIAPPTRIFDQVQQGMLNSSEVWASVILTGQPKLAAAVTALFPAYNYSGMTPLAYDRWNNVLKPVQGCLPTDSLVFSDVSIDQLAEPDWLEDPRVQTYANMTQTGRKKFKGPLLVIAGEADIVVPPFTIESAVDDTCDMLKKQKWHESLEMVSYSAMNHFSVIQASEMQWLQWVKDRLSGVRVSGVGCTKKSVHGFRTDFSPMGAAPNFLEGWASPQEAWKYSL